MLQSQHPDAKGVSVGAILSNYQRVRVEHVCVPLVRRLFRYAYSCLRAFSCKRLSLIPLSYLWQRDQAELLSEMIATGMEAIFIKVAGIGLITRHLGKSLAEMQPTLMTLVGRPFSIARQ